MVVFGGRDFSDRGAMYADLDILLAKHPDLLIVEGEARGADRMAREWAESRGVPFEGYPAAWKGPLKKMAGFARNQQMVDSGLQGAVEYPGGTGTADMHRRLTKAGVPIWVRQ